MNKHFEDTRYYIKRAGETAKKGVREELEPIEERVTKLTGGEDEPEPGRVDEIRSDLLDLQKRAEGEAQESIGEAREKLQTVKQRLD